MSLPISSRVNPTASFAATLAMGKPVALEASADERETRGFISMTTIRPVAGSMANWTLEPPVSTPISRSTASEGVTHRLVFLVGQGERRGDGDAVAGVHPHGVDVLDRADDDAVVGAVADDLHLVFLPPRDRFLDQHFGNRGSVESGGDHGVETGAVPGDAAAGAAEGEGRADDGRQSDSLQRRAGVLAASRRWRRAGSPGRYSPSPPGNAHGPRRGRWPRGRRR